MASGAARRHQPLVHHVALERLRPRSACSSSWPIEAQTSVVTTWAPRDGFPGVVGERIFVLAWLRSEYLGVRPVALRAREPELEAEAARRR